jgi:DNA-binding NarL/FixJ family response regulator
MIARMSRAVIVVDDDAVFRGLARRMLAGGGLEVVGEASTVQEALELAEALEPDALLVDVGLPDGNGIELTQRLTAMAWRPRVVLTSSDPDAANPEDVRRVGAQAFVPKDELPNAPLQELLDAG